jgi:excisionase family DNA binding protein
VSDLFTLHQLAVRLRLPREWLREEALAGRLPCLRVGRKLLFNLSAVERDLAERAATSREVSCASH